MWRRWGTRQNFFLAFIELWKTRKIRILKKWKKIAGDIIILHMCTKNQDHMSYSSWDTEWDIFFFLQQESNRDCHFRPFFALLPHYWPRKLKFGKNVNNTWRYYPFTHLHHKSRSHDVWFQRYKVQRTEFLSFWATFCPLTLLTTKKIKILER